MTNRNRVISGEGKLVGISDWTFHVDSIYRVGPIENEDRQFCSGGFLHHVTQRRDVGVEARAHILNVIDKRIQIFQLFRFRSARLSVKRIDRQTGLLVFRV